MLLATELLLQTKLNLFLLYLSFQEMYSFHSVYSIVTNIPYHRQALKQMRSSEGLWSVPYGKFLQNE